MSKIIPIVRRYQTNCVMCGMALEADITPHLLLADPEEDHGNYMLTPAEPMVSLWCPKCDAYTPTGTYTMENTPSPDLPRSALKGWIIVWRCPEADQYWNGRNMTPDRGAAHVYRYNADAQRLADRMGWGPLEVIQA